LHFAETIRSKMDPFGYAAAVNRPNARLSFKAAA